MAAGAIFSVGRSHRRWLWTACPWGIHEMRSGVVVLEEDMYTAGNAKSKRSRVELRLIEVEAAER